MENRFYRLAQGTRMTSLGTGTYLGAPDDATDANYEAAVRAAISTWTWHAWTYFFCKCARRSNAVKRWRRGMLRFYRVAAWDGFRAEKNEMDLHRLKAIARKIAGQAHCFRFVQLPFDLAMPEVFTQSQRDGGTSLLQAVGGLGMRTEAQRAIQFSRSTPRMAVALVGMTNYGR